MTRAYITRMRRLVVVALIALPMKIAGGSGGPLRIVALLGK